MLRKSTPKVVLLLVVVAGTVAFGLARSAPVASQDDADTEAKIENAMSAAPSAISAEATILDWETDDAGNFVVLREGTNGWSCLPNTPGTPTDDPMCVDAMWMNWLQAYVAGEEPQITGPGIAYMLQGESAASNTDPFATEPAAGEDWLVDPPHVMLLLPGDLDQTVFSTDHASGGPFIM
ncbi:MAG: hypothetical protein KY456_16085, partial [Chloroflexi bacterium]|nr:hypothetical protein [Chloroflexota bacterium]